MLKNVKKKKKFNIIKFTKNHILKKNHILIKKNQKFKIIKLTKNHIYKKNQKFDIKSALIKKQLQILN